MTNRVVLNIVFVMGLVFTLFSQESKSSIITHNQSSPVLAPEKLEQVQKKIAKIDSHLQAIETKRAFSGSCNCNALILEKCAELNRLTSGILYSWITIYK